MTFVSHDIDDEMDRVRMRFQARGDRVKPRLQLRQQRDKLRGSEAD